MRIIAGVFGSRKIKTLDGIDTRPTLDRVRESLFNILGSRLRDAVVLDLFAGSGALGLEALSRGSRYVVFNDQARKAVSTVEENVLTLGVQENCQIICQEALRTCDLLARTQSSFDLIFLDPPYDKELYTPVLYKIWQNHLLVPGGMIVCEHRKGDSFAMPESYRIYDRRTYGKISLSFIIEEVVS